MINFKINKITYIRILVYLFGAMAVFAMVYINAYQDLGKEYAYFDDGSKIPEFFKVPAVDDFDRAEIVLEIHSQWEKDKIQVKITKFILNLEKNRNEMITRKEKLDEILFKDNETEHPNGSIFAYKKDLYLLSKGELRMFSSKNVFEILGFKEKFAQKLSRDEFSQFILGSEISEEIVNEKEYPFGVIIKSNEEYFITGSKNLYPVFSPSLILEIWNNFAYVETNSIEPRNMVESQCYVLDDGKIFCEAEISRENLKYGNAYYVKVLGVPKEGIKSMFIKLEKEISLGNLLDSVW